jgi:hypothetical protein
MWTVIGALRDNVLSAPLHEREGALRSLGRERFLLRSVRVQLVVAISSSGARLPRRKIEVRCCLARRRLSAS